MAESIVEATKYQDKMGETAASNAALEESVSFGKFENDSLSWEKWSSFSPNKYLEEVEKWATPGSVAQKKAYFEAHYKEIAAQKAELQEQEKQMEDNCFRSEYQNGADLIEKTCRSNSEIDLLCNQETNLISEVNNTHVDEPNEYAEITNKCQSLSFEGVKEEFDGSFDNPESNKPEETVSVKEIEETPPMGPRETKERPQSSDNIEEINSKIEEEDMKLDHPKESHKTMVVNAERNMAKVKKKPTLPITTAPRFSTPRMSKPPPTNIAMSASRSSIKKGNGSSLPRSKISSTGDSKKVAPRSLHMSFSLSPTNSGPTALTTTRKSFIMEKMGDKDIVKRAFKSFQNNFNQLKSSGEVRSSVPQQVPARTAEPRVSPSMIPRKEKGGSLKASGLDNRSAKTASSSFGLKNNERSEKRKEFYKKVEEKSNAKEAERTHLRSKLKEEKKEENKKLRQSLNFKATPMPRLYHGQKLSKSTIDKVYDVSTSFHTHISDRQNERLSWHKRSDNVRYTKM